ncbi:MAG: roadblock/LC7 domain-containing protein [Acidimicrobiia bacterium]|nr:roadblock/LC7 domain-containing protein [Acidimicrobiia bacterium]
MERLSADAQNLNWLVSSFAGRVAGVTRALVVSADGLLIAMSVEVDRTKGDQLAAIVSGLASLAHGARRCLGNRMVKQMIVEMDGEFLFAMTISDGSTLCVTASAGSDLGFVGYEMGLLVSRVGDALTPALRSELQSSLPR